MFWQNLIDMNFFKSLLFIAFTLLSHGVLSAQEWESFESPQQINDLVDTGEELLMATDAGLVVLNKTTLEKSIFNVNNSSLPTNHIQTITLSPNGQAYIGTYDMVMALFNGSDFVDLSVPENVGFDDYSHLYDLEIAENGDFWLGTSEGIFHKQGQNWFHYAEAELGPDFFEVWDIEINEQGEVFVGASNIMKYANGEWSNISSGTDLQPYLHVELFFANNGDLYFAGDLDVIGRYDGSQWHLIDNGGLNGSQIIGFAEDTAGNIFFNTMLNGIFRLEGNISVQEQNPQLEAFDYKTSYYHIDEYGHQWLNNNIYLSVNKNGEIGSTSISNTTIEMNGINKIREGENGDLFFLRSFANHAPILNNEGTWGSLESLNVAVQDVLSLSSNDIWVASNEGVHHFNGVEWEHNSLQPCRNLSINSNGKIYAQADDRIYMINNGVLTEYNTTNSPLTNLEYISGIGIDANDNLWIAAFNWDGEAMIQKVTTNGDWTTYNKTDIPVIKQPSGDFHFDADGNVWIPSDQAGAIRFDGTTWTNPIVENINTIENYHTYAIESDANGMMYFSHQYGVTTLLNGEWGNINVPGIPTIATSSGSDIEFDKDGRLWWGSSRYGIFAYTPETITSTINNTPFSPNSHLSAYPNPVQDNLMLDFNIAEKTEVDAIIYNSLGQLVSQLSLGQFNTGTHQHIVDVSHLESGYYILQLRMKGKFFTTEFVVK
jgi:ligand-binding sensor domain-containing protein